MEECTFHPQTNRSPIYVKRLERRAKKKKMKQQEEENRRDEEDDHFQPSSGGGQEGQEDNESVDSSSSSSSSSIPNVKGFTSIVTRLAKARKEKQRVKELLERGCVSEERYKQGRELIKHGPKPFTFAQPRHSPNNNPPKFLLKESF